MAVHLSRRRIASVNRLTIPAGTPVSFALTSSGVMNSFFVPQLGSQIYTMAGMVTHLNLQADAPGTYPGLSAQFSGDGFADMQFHRGRRDRGQVFRMGCRDPRHGAEPRCEDVCRSGEAERKGRAVHLPRRDARTVRQHCQPRAGGAVRRTLRDRPDAWRIEALNLLGRLSWSAIPFDQPIPMAASVLMILAILLILGWIVLKGYLPYLWREWITSVDHKRIGVMYCVLALVMLLRGFTDAIMMRSQQAVAVGGVAGLPSAGAFRPDLLGARHHHDLFHGDAVRDRADEFCHTAATRRARRGVSDPELGEPVARRVGRASCQRFPVYRRIRENRLGRVSAAQRAAILARRRRRLLSLGVANLRHRHAHDRNKFCHHHPENTRTRNELHAHAGVLLDRRLRRTC